MATIGFHIPVRDMTLEQLIEFMAKQNKELDWAFSGNIDFKNIKAKGITAEKMNVKELSAISADLGKITAGEIYGTYIATAEGTYPRAEMSVLQSLFAVYQSLGNAIRMISTYGGTPAVLFDMDGVTKAVESLNTLGNFSITTSGNSDFALQSAKNIDVTASSGDVRLSAANQLRINGSAGYTGSFPVITSVNFATESVTQRTVVVTKGIITGVL